MLSDTHKSCSGCVNYPSHNQTRTHTPDSITKILDNARPEQRPDRPQTLLERAGFLVDWGDVLGDGRNCAYSDRAHSYRRRRELEDEDRQRALKKLRSTRESRAEGAEENGGGSSDDEDDDSNDDDSNDDDSNDDDSNDDDSNDDDSNDDDSEDEDKDEDENKDKDKDEHEWVRQKCVEDVEKLEGKAEQVRAALAVLDERERGVEPSQDVRAVLVDREKSVEARALDHQQPDRASTVEHAQAKKRRHSDIDDERPRSRRHPF